MIENVFIKLYLLTIFVHFSHSNPRAKKISRLECTIDEKKDFTNPQNVYECEQFQKCCLEYGQPSCCEHKLIHQIM